MAGRFSVEAVFKAVDRMTAPVSRMQNRIGKMTRSIDRGVRNLNRGVDRTIGGIKKLAAVTAIAMAATSAAMGGVINTGADFEQTIVNAAVKFPGEIRKGSQAFAELEDAARRTGSTTEFTASQAAEALNFLAMAGFDAKSSIAALPGVVNLATAASIDLGTATDIATDSLGAFNLLSKDAATNQRNLAKVSDILALTSVRANTTIEAMFEAIKDGAPVGVAAGQSVETIAAMIGTMANAGIKGTRAGTALKNIFLAMTAPASEAAKVMRRLGIQTTNADGSIRDAIDVFQDFNRVAATLPDSQKMQAFDAIFGKIPIAAAINLTNASKQVRAFRDELASTTGTTKKMATVMRDTVEGRFNSLKSAIEGVQITIFTMTSGPLADVIDKMTQWVRANEQVIASGIAEFITNIATNFFDLVTALTDIAVGVSAVLALGVALKTVSTILGVITAIMAVNPIVLGIMAAIAAVALLSGKLDPIIEAIKTIGSGIMNAFSAVGSLGKIFGFGGGEDTQQSAGAQPTPQVVSPQERTARMIEETRTTNTSEVTIKDETGRAQVTRGGLKHGLKLESTGAF